MFGYQHGELRGHPVESLIPAGLQAAHRSHRASYAQAPAARPMGAGAPLVGLRKDGTTFPAQISLSPVTTSAGEWQPQPPYAERQNWMSRVRPPPRPTRLPDDPIRQG